METDAFERIYKNPKEYLYNYWSKDGITPRVYIKDWRDKIVVIKMGNVEPEGNAYINYRYELITIGYADKHRESLIRAIIEYEWEESDRDLDECSFETCDCEECFEYVTEL